ncbi:M15 family metallopeptidase [Patescibacteria group bacterium]|nr:M15 family metallopeptidase [Patescibacteria group bacterium]
MVRTKHHNRTPKRYTSRRHPPRLLVTGLLLLTAATLCGLFLSYANWRQLSDERQLKQEQAAQFAALDKRVAAAAQKKIDDAKKAEAAAKAAAAADEAARKQSAGQHPDGTVSSSICAVTIPSTLTVVINKKHCFSPLNWAPSDLASVQGYLLRSEAATQLGAMINAASAAGMGFSPSSAYRSYDNQVTTYNTWVAINGSQAAADTVSARPGYSEHQTGLAVDLQTSGCALECFAGTAAYQWLKQYASDYGFIERYPVGLTSITGYSPEAWHWRYIGVATARDMKTKGIQTLEEYLGIPGGDY